MAKPLPSPEEPANRRARAVDSAGGFPVFRLRGLLRGEGNLRGARPGSLCGGLGTRVEWTAGVVATCMEAAGFVDRRGHGIRCLVLDISAGERGWRNEGQWRDVGVYCSGGKLFLSGVH